MASSHQRATTRMLKSFRVMTSTVSSNVSAPEVAEAPAPRLGLTAKLLFLVTALAVVVLLVWQGVAVGGAPDPMSAKTNSTVAALDIAVLVFREGLECILVLAAITASMTGPRRVCRPPVAWGAA